MLFWDRIRLRIASANRIKLMFSLRYENKGSVGSQSLERGVASRFMHCYLPLMIQRNTHSPVAQIARYTDH